MVRWIGPLVLTTALAGCTDRVLIDDVLDAALAPDAPVAPPILDSAEGEQPGRWNPNACNTIPKHAHFKPEAADLMILLDRSSTMQGSFAGSYSKLGAIESVLTDAINTYQKYIKLGLAEFPDPACGRLTCCPAKQPVEPGYNAALIFDDLECYDPQSCLSSSGDSPSHYALAAVQNYHFVNDPQAKYVLLIAASEPSCGGESPDDACNAANVAANTLGNIEIPVVVLTVGYQPSDKSCLVKVSKGGNKISMPTGAKRLYTPPNITDLKDNVSTLFAAVAQSNCTLSTGPTDYVPDDAPITVKLGSSTLSQADCGASSGWCFPSPASRNEIKLLGSTCDQYLQQAPTFPDVTVDYSCSTCPDSGSFCFFW